MLYSLWHRTAVKKATPLSESNRYGRATIFGLVIWGALYGYITWLGIPGVLNKATADASIILIGLSMLLTSLCYFWDFWDSYIIYRKHLGLVGFAFGLTHVGLSMGALEKLFLAETWHSGQYWAPLTGAVALVIFTIMALISNRYATTVLGGATWRKLLRTGYIAVALIWLHVFFLKSARILTWYQDGMQTPPAASVLVLIFMLIVMLSRIALWWALKKEDIHTTSLAKKKK